MYHFDRRLGSDCCDRCCQRQSQWREWERGQLRRRGGGADVDVADLATLLDEEDGNVAAAAAAADVELVGIVVAVVFVVVAVAVACVLVVVHPRCS